MEFSSEPSDQLASIRLENAASEYIDLIEADETALVDIIVFPESTLNSIQAAIELPEPSELISPCNDDKWDLALRNISCSAIRARKYVVINLTEAKKTTVDNIEKILYYNANVVFDRNGRIISRYRKFNLFGEAGISVTPVADVSSFTTDFNVTFGHFICFDLLFKTPTMQLLADEMVTDIVYPTMWFSELPFLTATQAQAMWTVKQRVNFLAAGAGNPSYGSTGTGIYSKQGAIKTVMSGNPLRKVLVAEVPKKQFWNDQDLQDKFTYIPNDFSTNDEQVFLKRDHLDVYSAQYLDFAGATAASITENLCYDDDLCCKFDIKASKRTVKDTSSTYKYFLVVFDGVRSYDGFATGGIFTCALISCLNSTLASCGKRFEPTVEVEQEYTFDMITIEGDFRTNDDNLALPNTLDRQLNPLLTNAYTFEEVPLVTK